MITQCFDEMQGRQELHESLRKFVDQTLEAPTTLVILDGLDGNTSLAKTIQDEAQQCNYRILITTKPYAVQSVSRYADLIV